MAHDRYVRGIVDDISNRYEFGTVNLVNDDALEKNILIDASGSKTESTFYDSTTWIPVDMGTYTINTFEYTGNPTWRLCTYDKNKTFIRRITPSMSLYPSGYTFEFDSNEKFVRISFQNEKHQSGIQKKNVFIKGTVALEYLPYVSSIDTHSRYKLMQFEGNLFSRIRKEGAIFSICDDDTSSAELVEVFKNTCDKDSVKGCFATITFRLDNDTDLVTKLKDYEDKGFGVYYHCKQQIDEYNPSAFDISVVEPNFVQGLRDFRGYGFRNDDIWVIPFGGATDSEIDMAKRHGVNYAIETQKNVQDYKKYVTTKYYNLPSEYLNRYCVIRQSLGFGEGTPTIAGIKSAIDECVANGGWMIFMTHTNTWYQKDAGNHFIHDDSGNLVPIVYDGMTGEQKMREIMQYCKSKNMKNKTIAEGLRLYKPSYDYFDMF